MIDSLGLFRGGVGGDIRNVQERNSADVTTLLSAGKDPQAIDLRSINFFSPVSELDVNTRLLVLQYRDAISGDVIRQYPTEGRLRAYTDGAAIIPADIAGFNTKNQPDAPVPENPALKPIIVRQSEELAAGQQGTDTTLPKTGTEKDASPVIASQVIASQVTANQAQTDVSAISNGPVGQEVRALATSRTA